MAKKRRRQAFPTSESEIVRPKKSGKKSGNNQSKVTNPARAGNTNYLPGGLFGFFRDFGVRETIESVIIAVVLALMFRAYEAEAFIIPTGSMAPSLQGQHVDFECEKWGCKYRAGASLETSNQPPNARDFVRATYCPICQFRTKLDKRRNANHGSNEGDRILVNKFIYDFDPPKRWDVIVFKNPNNGKQNYIKRLTGLPGENLIIENGDLFSVAQTDGAWSRSIIRKPAKKMAGMLQMVHDTEFVSKDLEAVNWPRRW